MIRWNPKTGRWSDELPSRLCNWLASDQMLGAAAGLSPATITRVDQALNNSGVSLTTAGLAAGLTGPGILVVGIGDNASTATAASVSNSGTALTWVNQVSMTTNKTIFMAWANVSGTVPAGTTFTYTKTAGSNFSSAMVSVDWLQGTSGSPVDQSGSNNNASASSLTTSLTNTNSDDIMIACFRGNTVSWTGPAVSLGNISSNYSSAYLITNTTGIWGINATCTPTQVGMGAISFKRV